MTRTFVPSTEVTEIRNRVDHPIVDGDGHQLECTPLVRDYLGEIADGPVLESFDRFVQSNYAGTGLSTVRPFWGQPMRNTLDRMTVTLPDLLYRRMDECGFDFALIYPTDGLAMMAQLDGELRQAGTRALNTYYAETFAGYRDRLEPVAVIPTFTPDEALAELDFAVAHLGLKTIVMNGVIVRVPNPEGSPSRLDTLAFNSDYDYDPVWARCAQLGVAPTFHSFGFGWGSRTSPSGHVFNHLGHFGAAQEAVCRSLIMGGAAKRFPNLRFGFLEGGAAWPCQLLADVIGHFEKRNKDVIDDLNPATFDMALCRTLLDEYALGRMADKREQFVAAMAKRAAAPLPEQLDDFQESLITSARDVVDIFEQQFFYGCEADDPLNALAFNRKGLPDDARLNAFLGSDIGHWDVRDIRGVLPEAWELVEDGHITEEDFAAFSYGNVSRMLTSMNPAFFTDTVLAGTL